MHVLSTTKPGSSNRRFEWIRVRRFFLIRCPELNLLKSQLRSGDVVVVDKLDRFGRSLKDLIALMSDLESKDVPFISLKDSIDYLRSRNVGIGV